MKTLKLLAQLGMVILCGAIMTGCNSAPSPGDAEAVLRQQIESESGGQIKLVTFKKTDGRKFAVNSMQGYKMDFEADIEFQADGTWLSSLNGMEKISFKVSTTQAAKGSWADFANTTIGGGIKVHHSDRVKFAGVMVGEKKESGWKFAIRDSHFISGSTNNNGAGETKKVETDDPNARIKCAKNLKEFDLAFRVWGGMHDDHYPFNLSTEKGGTMELCKTNSDGFELNSATHFQVMSNELSIPRILWCPSDTTKRAAARWSPLTAENVSYQIHSTTKDSYRGQKEILVRCPIHGSILYSDGTVFQGLPTQP